MTRLLLAGPRHLRPVLVPVLAVAAAIAVNDAIPELSEHTPLLMMLAAVTITALLAGLPSALAAALVGGIIGEAKWLPIEGAHGISHLIPLTLFGVLGLAIALVVAQRAAAYRDVEAREAHYRTLVRLCPDPVLAVRDGAWAMANPAAVALLGAESDRELLGRRVLDFIAPSNHDLVLYRIAYALTGARTPLAEVEWVTMKGERVVVQTTSVGVGHPSEGTVLVFAHDLRDRKRREAELRRVSDVLTTVIDSSPTAIITVDGEKRVTLWNHAAENIFGWRRDEVLGKVYPLVPDTEEDRRDALANYDHVVEGGAPLTRELKRVRRDGTSVDVLISGAVLAGEGDRPGGAVISALDITDRKRADRVLAESEERYRSLYAAMGEGVALLHPLFDAAGDLIDYHVLDVNPAFERITGIEEGRALMALGSALFPDQVSVILEQYRAVVKEQQSVRFEASFAGAQKRLGISAFPMGGSRFAAVFEDLTERKRLEQQLVQAQKMEAVGQLAGGVAHDFNNLLTTILGYSEVVAERFPAGDQGREDLEQVHKAGQAAAALTRQLLAFSRRQILKPVTFDLNAKLADTHALVRRLVGEHIELAFAPSGGSLHVTLDPGQVEQIVLNLAANARDAMPEGGRITIRTSTMTIAAGVRPNGVAIAPGRYAVLGVSDTGTGMSPDVQARLFEPFFTTKETGKGTGLGLSTVYGIVKQSGGYITVDSQPGKGSTFHLYFPAAAGCGEPADGDRPAPRPYRRSARVLVVEDNEPLRHLAVKTLTRYGYQVLAAEDAVEALSMLETVPRIDLLLTDIGLPGLDGAELAETVLRQHPDVRVLYMTGHPGDADTRRRLIEDVPLLQKPFTLSALVEHVQEALVR